MDQVTLKWESHVANLLTVMDDLRVADSFVDVTIACEGQFINAHKLVLSAGSEFFRELFIKNPAAHPTVVMQEVKYVTLKVIIDFLYRGEALVDQSHLEILSKAANTLSIKGLTDICKEKLQHYNDENSSPNVVSNEPKSSSLRKKQRTQSFRSQPFIHTLGSKTEETSSLFHNNMESGLRILDAQSLSAASSAFTSNDNPVCLPPKKQVNSKDSLTEVEVLLLNIENADPISEEEESDPEPMDGDETTETIPNSPRFDTGQRYLSVERNNQRENCDAERRKILQLLHQVIKTQGVHSNYLEKLVSPKQGSCVRACCFRPLGLPAKTMDEFTKWDSSLESSETTFENAVQYFSSKCGLTLKQSVRRIMKQAMTEEVASSFNWAGRGEKIAFQTTRFKDVLMGAILQGQHTSRVTHQQIEDAVKVWLKASPQRLKFRVTEHVEDNNGK